MRDRRAQLGELGGGAEKIYLSPLTLGPRPQAPACLRLGLGLGLGSGLGLELGLGLGSGLRLGLGSANQSPHPAHTHTHTQHSHTHTHTHTHTRSRYPRPTFTPVSRPRARYNSGMGEIFRKVAAITPVMLRGKAGAASLPPPAEECDADASGAVPVAPSM